MIITLILFIFGLFIGSFLNVIVDRLPSNKSFIIGRSKCDFCGNNLQWFDLIPLFSFIFLKRRCRSCKKKLSFYYPITELITGFLFSLSYLFFYAPFISPLIIYDLLIISCFIIILFTDLKYGIIPNQIIIFGSVIVFINLIFNQREILLSNLIAAILAFLFFIILILITKGRGMGMGDAKFAFLIGLFLGYPGAIFSIYVAFLTGALVSIILILLGIKKIKKDTIPFGPFLSACTIIVYLFSNQVSQIFFKLFG